MVNLHRLLVHRIIQYWLIYLLSLLVLHILEILHSKCVIVRVSWLIVEYHTLRSFGLNYRVQRVVPYHRGLRNRVSMLLTL